MVKVPDFVAYDSKIVMDYIQEFANLTEIPHPSGHMARMTAYLLDWAAARGVRCEAEPCGNVVMDVPASPGFEGAPLVDVYKRQGCCRRQSCPSPRGGP